MIVILKKNHDAQQLANLRDWLKSLDIDINVNIGQNQTVLGLIGDTSRVDADLIQALDIVEDVKRVQEPYKKVNRKFHPEPTVIDVGGVKIGGGNFAIMAGPCSVENVEQVIGVAKAVQAAGANILRGGAFKPRTSPYAFQGLGKEGIDILVQAKKETGMPIVSELMELSQLPYFEDVDLIQIGARNMQNFNLLRELGKINKPILLKRGLSATVSEFLMSAEYIMAGGNEQVILCERGIRTFETATRNTQDISCVPVAKSLSHLPIIVDPSHATGVARFVTPMAMAATAAGADGLMIEVHNDPARALCDGAQSLTPEKFAILCQQVNAIRPYAWQE